VNIQTSATASGADRTGILNPSVIGDRVDRYHHRPHSRLNYKTPIQMRLTWEDLKNIAA